jgi:acetolactate synthase-1/2/3 large subunit
VIDGADLVFFLGCRAGSVTTERWRSPKTGTRILHMDSDPMVIAANYPTEVGLVCDARLGLDALNAALRKRGAIDTDFQGKQRAQAAQRAKAEFFAELSGSTETPIRPERLIAELQLVLPEDAVIIADPGTPCPYLSAYYQLPKSGRHFISNRAHGALGYSLSATVGAAFGRPNAKVVGVMGDGSFGFTAGELETIVRYNVPVTLIVCSNSTYGWIKAGQKAGFGERYFSVDFSETRHAAVAEAFGVQGFRVENPDELQVTLAKAVAVDGPTLVDVVCQPLNEARAPVSEWVA